MRRDTRGAQSRFGRLLTCGLIIVAVAGLQSKSSWAAGWRGRYSAVELSISGTPMTQVQEGQTYSFTPTVSLTRPKQVSFSIQNKPSWATFSIVTGQLTGTPTSTDLGAYADVVISVSDGGSTAALPGFTITVTGAGTATLAWQAPTANTNGTALTDLAGYVLEYGQSASALTQSVTIGSATTTSYTLNNLSAGTWYFSVSAYTSAGAQSAFSNVVSTTVQ